MKQPSKKKTAPAGPQTIELRCSKSSDGKYNASTYINGKHLKDHDLNINRGTEFSIVLLYQNLKKKYPKDELHVKGLDKHGMDEIQRADAPA